MGTAPQWPRYDPSVDRQTHFTNSGVTCRNGPAETLGWTVSERVWSGWLSNRRRPKNEGEVPTGFQPSEIKKTVGCD